MHGFGIDIGGSGIKGAPVDLDAGALAGERFRIPTPQPSIPAAVTEVVGEVVDHFGWRGPVGCTIPAVVRSGIVYSAANIDESWIGTDARTMFAERLETEVTILNDADAAGEAEVRYGAGSGEDGVVILLTFGTGIGSAIYVDGTLLPNTELGHLEFHGMEAEHFAAARLVEHDGMDLEAWSARVDEYLRHLVLLFSPDLIVFGGGISKRFDLVAEHLNPGVRVVPAALRNNAGIVGAAAVAGGRSA